MFLQLISHYFLMRYSSTCLYFILVLSTYYINKNFDKNLIHSQKTHIKFWKYGPQCLNLNIHILKCEQIADNQTVITLKIETR